MTTALGGIGRASASSGHCSSCDWHTAVRAAFAQRRPTASHLEVRHKHDAFLAVTQIFGAPLRSLSRDNTTCSIAVT